MAGWYCLARCDSDHGDGLPIRPFVSASVSSRESRTFVIRVRRNHSQCAVRNETEGTLPSGFGDRAAYIFDALDEQTFTLHLDLINTATSCTAVSIVEVIESFTYVLPNVLCKATNGTVSIVAVLPQHKITVRAILNDVQLVGGVRVGLSGPGQETQLYTLNELNFNRALFSDAAGTLAQRSAIKVSLTKVSRSYSSSIHMPVIASF